MQNRLEALRDEIDRLILEGNPDRDYKLLCKYNAHMYGVAHFCNLLAMRRGLDQELATTIGAIHDIDYMTGRGLDNHAPKAAEQAREVLRSMNASSEDEIDVIYTAILMHDDIGEIHGVYDELLKDADIMDHILLNPGSPIPDRKAERFVRLCKELGITR
jgi:uncharacterized protein